MEGHKAFGCLLTCWWVRGGVIYIRDISSVMLLFEFQWKYTICQWWYGKWRCSAWNRKSHLELSSLLFCCVCYGIYCDIISYVYRVVIQVCDIMYIFIYTYIFCLHAYTSDIIFIYTHTHIFVLLFCLRFRRWFFLFSFCNRCLPHSLVGWYCTRCLKSCLPQRPLSSLSKWKSTSWQWSHVPAETGGFFSPFLCI